MPALKPRPAGRPRSLEPRDQLLRVRLTAHELQEYQRAAKGERKSLGEWVREAVQRALTSGAR